MSEQDTLTAAEVQSLLGISAPTFYRWVKSGRLQGIRVGRRWRFPRAAIEGLLASDGAAQREAYAASSSRVWSAFVATVCLLSFRNARKLL